MLHTGFQQLDLHEHWWTQFVSCTWSCVCNLGNPVTFYEISGTVVVNSSLEYDYNGVHSFICKGLEINVEKMKARPHWPVQSVFGNKELVKRNEVMIVPLFCWYCLKIATLNFFTIKLSSCSISNWRPSCTIMNTIKNKKTTKLWGSIDLFLWKTTTVDVHYVHP